jgi:GNAT superfamily N-acetyltransferase
VTRARGELSVRPVAREETRALRQAVLRPYQRIEELSESEPPDAFAVGAFDGEELVAVGLIGPEDESARWRVRGMATRPERRGQGAGSAVLTALLEHAQDQGARRVWASVRVAARTFYERAGFVVSSEVFEQPPIGPHVIMEREM